MSALVCNGCGPSCIHIYSNRDRDHLLTIIKGNEEIKIPA